MNLLSLGLLAATGAALLLAPLAFHYFRKKREQDRKQRLMTAEEFGVAWAKYMEELISNDAFRNELLKAMGDQNGRSNGGLEDVSSRLSSGVPTDPPIPSSITTHSGHPVVLTDANTPPYTFSTSAYVDESGRVRFDSSKRSEEMPIQETAGAPEGHSTRGEYPQGNIDLSEAMMNDMDETRSLDHNDELDQRESVEHEYGHEEEDSDFEKIAAVGIALRGAGDEFYQH